ncbi:MAG: hypothetical protein VX438_02165 [Planctomycetota bacterium]|nr:hypothetical protein [Planctomycetota bacterium]
MSIRFSEIENRVSLNWDVNKVSKWLDYCSHERDWLHGFSILKWMVAISRRLWEVKGKNGEL